MDEKQFYSKAEVRRRLKIGRTRYSQLIDAQILPAPICIGDGTRPVHTAGQLLTAENRIYAASVKALQSGPGKRRKPLSQNLKDLISSTR